MNIKRKFNNDQQAGNLSLGRPSLFAKDPEAESPDLGLYSMEPGGNIDYTENWKKNIELINHRISQLHKELSYWDLYQLSYQVKTPEELNSVFEGLLPGQALVINTENNFTQNNETYAKGDVVLKLFDESAAVIKAINAGIYKPGTEHVTDPEPYIEFIFQKEIPSEDEPPVQFPITNFDASAGFIYGWYKDISATSSFIFPIEKFRREGDVDDTVVYPYIRFFTSDKEEVFCDYDLTSDATYWTVSWAINPIPFINYIEVK